MATTHDLPGIFGSISPLIDHHGYLAIGATVLLSNIGVPILPLEAAVVVGAVFASNGHLDLATVGVIAAATAAVGSLIGYLIGDRAGHPFVVAKGQRIGITHERLAATEDFFRRRGVIVILVSRFLPFLRRWSGLAAGVSEMPFVPFAVANFVSAVAWAVVWTVVGDKAGDHLDALSRILSGRGAVILVALLAVVIAIAAVVRRGRTREE